MGNPGLAGFGCILCDSESKIFFVVSGLVGTCDSTKAEVIRFLEELQELN